MKAPCDWIPRDLNIITPYRTVDHYRNFFTSCNFEVKQTRPIPPSILPFKWQSLTITIFVHGITQRQVTIIESACHSVFPPMLTPLNTSRTTIATSDGVICLYPQQVVSGVKVCFRDAISGAHLIKNRRFGFTDGSGIAGRERSCGICCPILVRCVCGLRGSAHFDWGSEPCIGGSDRMLDMVSKSHFRWRLGSICKNVQCPFYLVM
jgi:hypothetical protein